MSQYSCYRIILAFAAVMSLCVVGIGIQGSSGYRSDSPQIVRCKDYQAITLEYQTEIDQKNISIRESFQMNGLCSNLMRPRVWVNPEKYRAGESKWLCWMPFQSCLINGYISMIIIGGLLTIGNLIFLLLITPVHELVPVSLKPGGPSRET